MMSWARLLVTSMHVRLSTSGEIVQELEEEKRRGEDHPRESRRSWCAQRCRRRCRCRCRCKCEWWLSGMQPALHTPELHLGRLQTGEQPLGPPTPVAASGPQLPQVADPCTRHSQGSHALESTHHLQLRDLPLPAESSSQVGVQPVPAPLSSHPTASTHAQNFYRLFLLLLHLTSSPPRPCVCRPASSGPLHCCCCRAHKRLRPGI